LFLTFQLLPFACAKTFVPSLNVWTEIQELLIFLVQTILALLSVAVILFVGWYLMWRLFLRKYKVVRDLVAVFFPVYVEQLEKKFGPKTN
jgi:hypothetical protein